MTRRLWAEALGSFFLFATVIGSGIMGETLAGGNTAVALLANTGATAAILFVLIAMLGPVSGAQFNPAVTLVLRLRGGETTGSAISLVTAQLAGGVLGVIAAHAMFDQPLLQVSQHLRSGPGQWLAEGIATFGLITTILLTARHRPTALPASVALYIAAAYWFTASTSFANPAITVARSLSDTFAGIAPQSVPGFVLAQVVGAFAAQLFDRHVMEPRAG